MPSIYLVSPKSSPQPYFGAEVFAHSGFAGAQLVADLSIATVAALVPGDFEVSLCDEHITPVDFETDADFVGLTGKSSQTIRMLELAREFRDRGRVVLIGGPVASLDPDLVSAHCDILVKGEIEEIAGTLFNDLRDGTWKAEYAGGQADLAHSPIPRWDLYPNDRALIGSVQTSRGCPFECEFCDVPAFVGRKQRHKMPEQILAELDVLYGQGYRSIFLADDNFTAYRQRTRHLLGALIDWNRARSDGRVVFSTQVSLDAAKDDELLHLCGLAGFSTVFIGLETPNNDSLRQSRKRQNVVPDLAEQIARFLDHGMMVISGLIVGFDADGADIFDRQRAFIQTSRIPVFSLGALVAPMQTPLRARLAKEGRLVDDAGQMTATPWTTNIVPKQMSRAELVCGLRDLCADIYRPDAFGARVIQMLERLNFKTDPEPPLSIPARRLALEMDVSQIIRRLYRTGRPERDMISRVTKFAISHDPRLLPFVRTCLQFYAQIKCVYQLTGFERSDSTIGRSA